MSAGDGFVVGVTRIVDHGPDSQRWNLAIIGDGYRLNELPAYHAHAQAVVDALRTTPPFDQMFAAINVHRIDVVSNESGADDPGCAGGVPTTAATYFDATFCTPFAGVPLDRLLTVNEALALAVASGQVPQRHQVLCIVNSQKYGGSGGAIATCSANAAATFIAIHEIGHSAFGLADEYGGNGAGTPAGEPTQPNVTRDANRATIKWRHLVDPSTPMPSACTSGAAGSMCMPPAVPPPPGAVGAYEGAVYADANTYRPLPSCYMRDYGPFCPVCSEVIRGVLEPFLPLQALESITLLTPALHFVDVPAGTGGLGVTVQSPIRLDVVTSRTLTLTITSGPTPGFGRPFRSTVVVTPDPSLPVATVQIWISYTSTSPGDAITGTVTVGCLETGQAWDIILHGNTVAT